MKKLMSLIKKLIQKAIKYIQTHKETKYLYLLALVLIIASIGFYIGRSSTSKNYMIKSLHKAITSNNTTALMKYIVVKDEAVPITEDSLQPFLDYLNNTEGRTSQFINHLKSQRSLEQGGMAVVKEVKKGFLTAWKVELRPVNLQISTSYEDTEIYVQDKSYGRTSEDNSVSEIGPLIPGKYNIKVRLANEYGESISEKSVQLLEGTIATSLTPPAEYITLLSNYPDAEVFINDKSTKLTVEEFNNIGPVPSTSKIKIHGEMTFPWGIVKSQEITLEDAPNLRLDIDPLNDVIKNQLEEEYRSFYEQLFDALNNEDLSLVEEPSRAAAKKLYDRYKSTALIFKDSYEITEILWEETAVALKREDGSYVSNALVNLELNKNKTIWGFPISSKPDKLSFQTFLTYNPDNDSWYVSSINDLSK
ncbi:TcaA 3rd/4th domain-containing protein [Alloiococcus sp. CFN-8]|uniref:TcaA 3rd/4th domain-containing protein n=1 Tax=Alloiococcus sp. CFN-8 TaxID=3416081 RepID=UPI003CE8745D